MDYVEQAHSLNSDEKAQALLIYNQCVKQFAHKKYRIRCDDPFVDLSSLFGERWMIENGFGVSSLSAQAYAKANVAFNYANLQLVICPLLGGPKSMLFWTRKEKTNAIQETHAGGDYRQAA